MYYGKTQKCDDRSLMSEIVEAFSQPKPRKTVWGNFRIKKNTLIYKAEIQHQVTKSDKNFKRIKIQGEKSKLKVVSQSDWSIKYIKHEINTIAIKIKRQGKSIIIGNSAILPLVGRTVSYGNESLNKHETEIQKILSFKHQMIPFNAMQEAGLDVKKIQFVDQGGAEDVTRKIENPSYNSYGERKVSKFIDQEVHFTGASLFKIDNTYFLFDIDREEIKYKIFNPFLVKLPGRPKSTEDAYLSLKPLKVIQAEKKGLRVKRQGEWFFIPTNAPKIPKLSKDDQILLLRENARSWGGVDMVIYGTNKLPKDKKAKAIKLLNQLPKPLSLQAGDNRPNNAEIGIQQNKKTYVKGKVEHSGREHRTVKLDSWHEAIPNLAIKSVTITGDID